MLKGEHVHYPYREGSAGRLRSRLRKGKISEALQSQPEIVSLAKSLLSKEAYVKAEELSRMLAGSEAERDAARSRLVTLVQPPPKRPMYYCQWEVQFLPDWTRNTLRYIGDFVDMLAKAAVYEKTKDDRVFGSPLGPALDRFQKCMPQDKQLSNWLSQYNRFLYRPGKHDMRLPYGREEHRFTSREVVLAVFVAMELADRITRISPMAARVRRDEPM